MNLDVSIVIPALNEREALPELLGEIEAVCGRAGLRWEAIVVDDGSRDGSFGLLAELSGAQPAIRGIRLRRNLGKSAALSVGFEHARGARIVTIDGDGQDDPADIPALLDALGDADLVSGWKVQRAVTRSPAASPRGSSTSSPGGSPVCVCTTRTAASRPTGPSARTRSRSTAKCTAICRSSPTRRADAWPRSDQPPAPRSRQLPLRARALPARRPRPADGGLHRPLSEPAATPLRRHRHRLHRDRPGDLRLPDGAEDQRRGDPRPPTADPRRAAAGRRRPAAHPWADGADDGSQPARGSAGRARRRGDRTDGRVPPGGPQRRSRQWAINHGSERSRLISSS
ncbi:MAG: glycosyltransferase [Thermoleophilia bacterium]|nr:glycosyltransferase [Thermoleophilia bacterium]